MQAVSSFDLAHLAGTVAGDFHTRWSPGTPEILAGGRLRQANLFGGTLSDADVELEITSAETFRNPQSL